jgi:uncharacterized protein
MLRSRLFLISLLVVLAYLLSCSVAGVFVAEATLHPGRRLLPASDTREAHEMARRQQSEVEEATVVAADGARLKAWSFHSLSGNGNAVLLLHGLSDNRMGMIGYAELLLSHGFSILMPDARGHGESGGELATYGMLERDDVHRWLDWLREHQHPVCIFGFGESMGAALLLGSLSSETGFCAVAAESPFSTLREVAYDRVGQFFRLGPWLGRSVFRPVVEVAFQYARWKYGLDLE